VRRQAVTKIKNFSTLVTCWNRTYIIQWQILMWTLQFKWDQKRTTFYFLISYKNTKFADLVMNFVDNLCKLNYTSSPVNNL
jgi:hypothetical protein